MDKFWIIYNNGDDDEIFLVREEDYMPYHYLISDGKSYVGGGKLLKKYCKLLDIDDLFKRVVDVLIVKKTIMSKYLSLIKETENLILEFDYTKDNFYKDCDSLNVIDAVKKYSEFIKTACIEVSDYYNHEYRNCFIKNISSKIKQKDFYVLNTLNRIEQLTN